MSFVRQDGDVVYSLGEPVTVGGVEVGMGTETGQIGWRGTKIQTGPATRIMWTQASGLNGAAERMAWKRALVTNGKPLHTPWKRALVRNKAPFKFPWKRATPFFTDIMKFPWGHGLRDVGPIFKFPWQGARFISSDGGPWTPPPPDPTYSSAVVNLHFCRLRTTVDNENLTLILGIDPCDNLSGLAAQFILPKKVYMVVNELTAVTISDGQPIPFFAMDISADDGSFGWSFNANGPAELMARLSPVAGAPVQIDVSINGIHWIFGIESVRRNRSTAQTAVSVSGRSLTALLGAPYMLDSQWTNAAPATAQQLVVTALDFTGVDLAWNIEDWLVPENAWSFQGTPLAAAQRVVEAAGAVTQSHRTETQLIIQPRYPVLPWEWSGATPDVEIASAVITNEGYERADKPSYNGVYISGENQGVIAFVKRTGSDGALMVPMITDMLNTDLVASRQRGSAILGQSGQQANMTVSLPVLVEDEEPGVIDVGKLVQINDPDFGNWRGLVRGVSIRASLPSVRQTLTIERHLYS